MGHLSVWMLSALAAALAVSPAAAPAAAVTPTVASTVIDDGGDGFNSTNSNALYAEFLDTSARRISRGILEFPLASFAGGTTAIASLDLNQVSYGSGSTQGVAVHGYGGDGVASLEDATAGSLLGHLAASNAGNGPRSLDVSSFVSSLLASGASFAGFVLRFPIEQTYTDPFNGGTIFISTNFTQWADLGGTVKPQLSVSLVPEPRTWALLATGLLMLIAANSQPRHERRGTPGIQPKS